MNVMLKTILCDVAMPSLTDILSELVEEHFLKLVFLLVLMLLVAAIIVISIVSSKKGQEASTTIADTAFAKSEPEETL